MSRHGGRALRVKPKPVYVWKWLLTGSARQLLNMTTDPNIADPVKLDAIKDALDSSGIQAKTTVSVEVSTSLSNSSSTQSPLTHENTPNRLGD